MKVQRTIHCFIFQVILAVITTASCVADISRTKQNVAIEGYDTTAYFTAGRPMKGDPKISYRWSGVTWLFASQDAKKMFMQKPDKYIPQFGGYCANGLSDGHKIEGDPKNWRIIDGKLYLYFSQYGREQWSGNVKPLLDMAGETWHDLSEK